MNSLYGFLNIVTMRVLFICVLFLLVQAIWAPRDVKWRKFFGTFRTLIIPCLFIQAVRLLTITALGI